MFAKKEGKSYNQTSFHGRSSRGRVCKRNDRRDAAEGIFQPDTDAWFCFSTIGTKTPDLEMICSTIRPRAAEETLKRAGDRPGLRVQRLFVTRNDSPRSQKITGASKPSTTQDGLIDSCISFHQAGKGETYAKIISNFGTFDFDTFFKWNPAVNADCSGIWAGYYYCVSVPGTPAQKPSATSLKPTATGGVQTPSPIQEGLIKNCNKFH